MEIVNGIPCFSCGDVARAKPGLTSPRQEDALAPLKPPAEVRGVNQPLGEGPRGTKINLAI